MSASAPFDLGQSALSAFRASRPAGGRESTPADDDALAVATLLRHASKAPDSPASRRILRHATRIAKALIGRRRLTRGNVGDTPNTKSPLDVFRILAEQTGASSRLHLEDHLLESLERLATPGSITQGRVVFRRAILKSDLGHRDAAHMQIDALLHDRQWKAFDELRLRGWLSLALLAYRRGNFPEAKRFALRVQRAAGDQHPALQGIAYNTLGTLAAEHGDFNAGLQFAWKAFELVRGTLTVHRIVALNNVAQMLLDAGYPAAARGGFACLLADSLEMRAAYAVIGGYAMASASLGDRDGVKWATAEVLRIARSPGYPDALATALFDCSEALALIGEHTRAGTLRRRSARLAEQYGVNQIAFKAQAPAVTVVPPIVQLNKAAKIVARRIREMGPPRVPDTVVYAE